eukprot:gene12551-8600_t
MSTTATATTGDAESMKQEIRRRLESSGQYARMRAMIVDAALQTLRPNEDKAEEGIKALQTPFDMPEELQHTLGSDTGILAVSLIMDFLQHLGLHYTASVLRLETGLDKGDELPSKQLKGPAELAAALHQPSGTTASSCALLQLLERTSAAVSGSSPRAAAAATGAASQPVVMKRVEEMEEEEEESKTPSSAGSEPQAAPHSNSEGEAAPSSSASSSASGHKGGDQSAASGSDSEKSPSGSSSSRRSSSAESRDSSAAEEATAPPRATEAEQDAPGEALKGAEDSTYYVSKWRGRTITRFNQVTGQQVQLEYLEECAVRILDPLDSATVDDCEGGELIIAACEGSVFLRNCKGMIVHVACKQLRLRDCEQLDLRLFTTTDPVIEMSHHITFRPFHIRLPNLSDHFKSCRLDPKVNRFVHVYDFTEDDTSLPQPHHSVRFPEHGLAIEDRCADRGTPVCPPEVEDLLALRLMPAASSESGENKSYNIKTGAKLWNADAGTTTTTSSSPAPAPAPAAAPTVAKKLAPLSAIEQQDTKPPLSVPVAAAAAAAGVTGRAARSGLDNEEYSDFEDDSGSVDTDDNCSVDEDDDEF